MDLDSGLSLSSVTGSSVTGLATALRMPLLERMRQARHDRTCPGAALAVLRGGVPALELYSGRWTYEDDSPEVAADSLFDLASLTKVLATTALAARRFDEGQLALDDRAPTVEVEVEVEGGSPPGDLDHHARPTWRRLLAHAAGLPACIPPIPDHDRGPRDSAVRTAARRAIQAAIQEAVQAAPLEHKAASDPPTTVYSDLGFIRLGEALTGSCRDFAEAVQRDILEPAGLLRSQARDSQSAVLSNPADATVATGGARALARAIPSERRPDGAVRQGLVHDELASALGGFAGHAGLFGNLRGVVALVQLWVPRVGVELWSAETSAAFTTPAHLDAQASRALGWETGLSGRPAGGPGWPAGPWFGHTGYTGGCVWITPRGDGFVLLTNRTWPERPSAELGSRAIHALRAEIGGIIASELLR